MLFRNMSSSETTGNFSAASTQYFTENAGLQLEVTVSAFPLSSHSDSGEGDFSRLYYGSLALRPAALLAPLVGADRTYTQPTRTFTSGLPMVWSPAPSPDITTAPTGKLALAGLPPARSSTSFTARLRNLFGRPVNVDVVFTGENGRNCRNVLHSVAAHLLPPVRRSPLKVKFRADSLTFSETHCSFG
jgi:hypothetical protein